MTKPGSTFTQLRVAMTGKASDAKTAEGDAPVFAYIASLPQPQRAIAEHIDALAAKTLPGVRRAVKWGMAYYGVDGGWCFAAGAFVGHVKLMFIRGTELQPAPPVTPVGMGKQTRGVELASTNDLDDRTVENWMRQAAATPFAGGRSADACRTSFSQEPQLGGQRGRGLRSACSARDGSLHLGEKVAPRWSGRRPGHGQKLAKDAFDLDLHLHVRVHD